jgi:hypothetical protein
LAEFSRLTLFKQEEVGELGTSFELRRTVDEDEGPTEPRTERTATRVPAESAVAGTVRTVQPQAKDRRTWSQKTASVMDVLQRKFTQEVCLHHGQDLTLRFRYRLRAKYLFKIFLVASTNELRLQASWRLSYDMSKPQHESNLFTCFCFSSKRGVSSTCAKNSRLMISLLRNCSAIPLILHDINCRLFL